MISMNRLFLKADRMVLQILHQFTNKVCAQQATRDKQETAA